MTFGDNGQGIGEIYSQWLERVSKLSNYELD